jgi:acetyl/propionyl-CoA carboxylase alpha subunit
MLLTDAGEFFFLEMNTRLQVEHPVTEAVTGRDLVEDQLRIAAGEPLVALGLGATPDLHGHAIEARLYAEDPESGFLPATGHLALVRWPEGVRVDTGIAEGDEVTDRYDPMIAKLIVHARTREEALERMRTALAATAVLGVRTNLRFLRWLFAQPAMRDGEVRTDTIGSLDLPGPPDVEAKHWQAAALQATQPMRESWEGGWRLNAPAVVRLRHGDEERSVPIGVGDADDPDATSTGEYIHVDAEGQSLEFRIAPPPTVEEAVRHAASAGGDGTAALLAPMPGRVIAVRVADGAAVRAHQPIIVIEAMKMEHAVVAPIDGTLINLTVREGQQVQRGDLLGEVAQSDA